MKQHELDLVRLTMANACYLVSSLYVAAMAESFEYIAGEVSRQALSADLDYHISLSIRTIMFCIMVKPKNLVLIE